MLENQYKRNITIHYFKEILPCRQIKHEARNFTRAIADNEMYRLPWYLLKMAKAVALILSGRRVAGVMRRRRRWRRNGVDALYLCRRNLVNYRRLKSARRARSLLEQRKRVSPIRRSDEH